MAEGVIDRPATSEQVYTAAELKDLRRRLAGEAAAGDGGSHEGVPDAEGNYAPEPPDPQEDAQIIVKFLRSLDQIIEFIIRNRIPEPHRELIRRAREATLSNLEEAISQLLQIRNEDDELYASLRSEGLTDYSLVAKASAFDDSINNGPIPAILDAGDKFVGSLSKVLPILTPFKEVKELVEHRQKYHADSGIIDIDIYGRRARR
jgi:hypothetical protein